MHDAALVGMLDRAADRGHQPQSRGHVQLVRIGVRQQVDAVHVFHREIGQLSQRSIGNACGMHLGDAGVVEPRERCAFAAEALLRVSIVAAQPHQLDRDLAGGIFLFGQIHAAHAALADQRQQAKVAQAFEFQDGGFVLAGRRLALAKLLGGKGKGIVERVVSHAVPSGQVVARAQTRLRPSDLARNSSRSAARMKSADVWIPGCH